MNFEVMTYEAFIFLDNERSWDLTEVPLGWRILLLLKLSSKEVNKEFNSHLINSISKSKFESKVYHLAKSCFKTRFLTSFCKISFAIDFKNKFFIY